MDDERLAQVHVFRAGYGPRLLGALMTLVCAVGALAPLLRGAFEPVDAGIRIGVVLAMGVICVRLFLKQGSYRLEVGPAGLCIARGPRPVSFAWDAFDSFGAPQHQILILRTRTQQLVTLTGWRQFDLLAALVTKHLERALTQRPQGLPTRH
jgi:hypothetical protein